MKKFAVSSVLLLTLVAFLSAVAAPIKVGITGIKAKSKDAKDVYKIGTVKKDAKVYIDRDYIILTVPKGFEGMQTIMTANDDKNQKDADFLTFSVDKDSVIYVAHDSRAEVEKGGKPPKWLADGFKKELIGGKPVAIKVTDANMDTVNLWKKEVKAGKVTLGGNAVAPSAGQGSNYFVIVTGKEATTAVDAQAKLSTTWAQIKSNQ